MTTTKEEIHFFKSIKSITGSSYGTWDDAIALIPNLTDNALAESQFDVFASNISAFVDPAVAHDYTKLISLLYCLHFMALFYAGSSKPVFDPYVYSANTGPVSAATGEKVSLEYASSIKESGWENDLSQTIFGQTAQSFVRIVSYYYGVNGNGSLYAVC